MPNAVAAKPERSSSVLVHRGTRAVQRLVEYAPATGGLALWARHADLPPRPPARPGLQRPAIVATDGHTIYYEADFDSLSLPEQAGLVAHQVLHVALRHPQRHAELQRLIGDVDLQLFNTCADAIVNSTLGHLSWLQLPANAVTLEGLLASALAQTPGAETALLEWDVERLYRAIDDRRQNGRDSSQRREDGPRSSRVRALGAGTATDLLPAQGADDAPEAQAEQLREWSERLLRAHTSDGEFSLLRNLLADLPRSRTPWQQVLRTQLARGLAPQRELSWSRPSRSYIANQGRAGPGRRMPFEPGHSATKRVPRLVVMVDVSGSIDRELMDQFAREIETLTRRLESTLVLVIGDDQVQKVAQYEPGKSDLRDINFNGGGGTDFTPLLEEADRHGPDIGVYLTDLDGPARFKPRWPVIWAVPQNCADAIEPFGRKLVLG